MLLDITQIRIDGGTQPRATYHFGAVDSYAEDMEAGATFPPVVVFYDGSIYWLADGFHRILAAKKIELLAIDADIRQGTLEDAQWYSYSVNQTHGLRRSNEDKRRAVEAALRHPKAVGMSNVDIAKHCGVAEGTIRNYRAEMETTSQITKSTTRTGRDGRTINTSNIGKSKSKERIPEQQPQNEQPIHEEDREEEDNDPLTAYEQQVAEQYKASLPDPLAQEVDRLVCQYSYEDLCRLVELLSERIAVSV